MWNENKQTNPLRCVKWDGFRKSWCQILIWQPSELCQPIIYIGIFSSTFNGRGQTKSCNFIHFTQLSRNLKNCFNFGKLQIHKCRTIIDSSKEMLSTSETKYFLFYGTLDYRKDMKPSQGTEHQLPRPGHPGISPEPS